MGTTTTGPTTASASATTSASVSPAPASAPTTTSAQASRPRSSRLLTAALGPLGEHDRVDLVVRRLASAIAGGSFDESERLPSEHELTRLLGVSLVTIREALVHLRIQGFIVTRRGRSGGSFVASDPAAVDGFTRGLLLESSRVQLADLGLHWTAIAGACAEHACRRATSAELDTVADRLADSAALDPRSWRIRVTDIHLELAALSQSVRLTKEHVRIQTELSPLLTLLDADADYRSSAHAALAEQIAATRAGDVVAAKERVRLGIAASVRALVLARRRLLATAEPDSHPDPHSGAHADTHPDDLAVQT